MPSSTERVELVRKQRDELKARIAEVGDLRPGSLVERYRRCGKAGCHCAGKGEAGHGPSWSLTRELGGKTVTRVIPAGAVTQTREQIAEYRRFRALVRELVETSEQLCDAKLEAGEAASDEAAKKGASRRPSRPKSRPRSRRS
jgi:hypothetical protein